MNSQTDLPDAETIAAGGADELIRAGLTEAIAAVEAHNGTAPVAETTEPAAETEKPLPAPVHKPAVVGMPALKDEPYEFPHCTISIGITLLPEDGNPEGRRVVLGVRDHNEAGTLRTVRLTDLSEIGNALESLLADEKVSLEKRKLAKATKSASSKPKPAAAKPAGKASAPAHTPAVKAAAQEPAKPAAAQITIQFEQ